MLRSIFARDGCLPSTPVVLAGAPLLSVFSTISALGFVLAWDHRVRVCPTSYSVHIDQVIAADMKYYTLSAGKSLVMSSSCVSSKSLGRPRTLFIYMGPSPFHSHQSRAFFFSGNRCAGVVRVKQRRTNCASRLVFCMLNRGHLVAKPLMLRSTKSFKYRIKSCVYMRSQVFRDVFLFLRTLLLVYCCSNVTLLCFGSTIAGWRTCTTNTIG